MIRLPLSAGNELFTSPRFIWVQNAGGGNRPGSSGSPPPAAPAPLLGREPARRCTPETIRPGMLPPLQPPGRFLFGDSAQGPAPHPSQASRPSVSSPGGRSASWRRTPSHAPRRRTRRDPPRTSATTAARRLRASLSALVSTARTGRSAATAPVEQGRVQFGEGVADVHQHHHPGQRLPRFQVPSDEGAPLPAHRAGHLGVAVPRQVHEPAPLVEREEVDQPGAAGGPAGPGEAAPAGERVDGARLPCVRPPRERHLAAAVGRKVADGGDADEEPGLAVVDRRCRRSARIRERVDPFSCVAI